MVSKPGFGKCFDNKKAPYKFSLRPYTLKVYLGTHFKVKSVIEVVL